MGKGGKTETMNSTQTTMPVLSKEWMDAFKAYGANINGAGANAAQQNAMDFFSNNMGHTGRSLWQGPAGAPQIQSNNQVLHEVNGFLNGAVNPAINSISTNAFEPLVRQAARQQGPAAMTNAALAGAAFSANAPTVNAQTGASLMNSYTNPWDRDVVNASVADFNANADRSLSGMRAGRDAAGAFGDRAAIADAVFQADAARGLGTMVSGLRQQGFNTAAGLGQQDAGRFLSADQTNAGNILNNNQFNAAAQNTANQFNAAAQNDASRFNADATNNRNQFNVNAGYQGDQQKMQAGQNMINATGQMADISQRTFDNTAAVNAANMQANLAAQGLNMDAANALMMGGGMTQEQLGQLIQFAQAANGSNTTTNQTSKSGGGGGILGFAGDVAKGFIKSQLKFPVPCWVAREVYGIENPRWLDFRDWLTWKAPRWLFRLYWKHGEKFAAWIKDKPKLKAVIRTMMEWCLT